MYSQIINWPAIIKLYGDDELIFINDADTWLHDPDLSHHCYENDDRLIDANGILYKLVFDNDACITNLSPCDSRCSTTDFCDLLKAHYLCLKHCCIPKFHISSINEGMMMLQQSSD